MKRGLSLPNLPVLKFPVGKINATFFSPPKRDRSSYLQMSDVAWKKGNTLTGGFHKVAYERLCKFFLFFFVLKKINLFI